MDIEKTKAEILSLIKSINRKDANIEGLVRYLTERSDFFTAPYTTKYLGSYEGGLAEHALATYKALCRLVLDFAVTVTNAQDVDEEGNDVFDEETGEPVYITKSVTPKYSDDTLKIVALLHDLSKTNFYETYSRNVKDAAGNWQQVQSYKVREDDDRFIYGTAEQTSEFMVRTFIPLTLEESMAILYHRGELSVPNAQFNVATVYKKYPLALLLHMADLADTFIRDSVEVVVENHEQAGE